MPKKKVGYLVNTPVYVDETDFEDEKKDRTAICQYAGERYHIPVGKNKIEEIKVSPGVNQRDVAEHAARTIKACSILWE